MAMGWTGVGPRITSFGAGPRGGAAPAVEGHDARAEPERAAEPRTRPTPRSSTSMSCCERGRCRDLPDDGSPRKHGEEEAPEDDHLRKDLERDPCGDGERSRAVAARLRRRRAGGHAMNGGTEPLGASSTRRANGLIQNRTPMAYDAAPSPPAWTHSAAKTQFARGVRQRPHALSEEAEPYTRMSAPPKGRRVASGPLAATKSLLESGSIASQTQKATSESDWTAR